ncbi:hypothetical protein FACS189472_08450 [Alphaproteobacteria bacterium]|nr:hypothetical protein FACS189472_08450 [Alphaproteobacteria bacterium]
MQFWIVGTDTDVGKTTVSAWICLHTACSYWKPIQTGCVIDESGASVNSDSSYVRNLTDTKIHPEAYVLRDPLSPYMAAIRENRKIDTSKIVGSWSDRHERKIFLAFGFCMMMASCIIMALATEIWHVFVGAAIYGIHWGATQGTFYAMVTDYSPPQIKGTSIGIFNLVYSAGTCVSNVLMGELWTRHSADVALTVNGAIAFIAAIGIIFVKPNKQKEKVGVK